MPNAFHDFDGLMMKDICKIIYPLEFSAPRNIATQTRKDMDLPLSTSNGQRSGRGLLHSLLYSMHSHSISHYLG